MCRYVNLGTAHRRMSIWGHVDRPLHRRTHPPQPGGGAVLRHRGQRTDLARGRRGGGPTAQGGRRPRPPADPGHRALLSRSGSVRLRPTGAPRPGPAHGESPPQGARRCRPADPGASRAVGLVHPRARSPRSGASGPRRLTSRERHQPARRSVAAPSHIDDRPLIHVPPARWAIGAPA